MHDAIIFLQDFVIILAAAVVVIFFCNRVQLPTVVGFLITGLLIGPSGLALVRDIHQVEIFAEIGVVILLFTIGLEFSLERLKQIQRAFYVGGTFQAAGTIGSIVLIATAMGYALSQSVFFGFLITLSSTAIVLKLYAERQEMEAPQGKLVIGILLYQDFLVVPMIVLAPVLGGIVAPSLETIGLRFGGGLIVVGLVFVIARYLMPRILHAIAQTRIREIFVLGALVICLALSLMTAALEFSLALGAFIAGIIISESEYSHQVVAEVTPFRDVFNSLFFISIGMLLNLGFVVSNPITVVLMGSGIFLIKLLVILVLILLMRFPFRISMIVAVSLAQIGEFSFVLANVGVANGLLDSVLYQTFLASSILTMIMTPLLIKAAPRIAEKTQEMMPFRSRTESQKAPMDTTHLKDHVVVVGFGLNGRNLSRVLRETGIPYVIVELDGDVVRGAQQEGEPILYGDATRPDILTLCQITSASVMVMAISDPVATRRSVRIARQLSPDLHIIVRTRFVVEIDELYTEGADNVIPEEFETSIEIFTRVLQRYHVPRNVINAQTKLLRGETYEMFRSPARTAAPLSEKAAAWLTAGTTEVFLVQDGSIAVDQSIHELDLRRRTGATIIAVVRGEKSFTNPPADFTIRVGDSLVLVANHADMERTFQYLEAVEE